MKEGIDSEARKGTKARLSEARVRLRMAEAAGAADVLRERLSKLTGLPAVSIQTEDSLPPLPEIKTEESATGGGFESHGQRLPSKHARAQYLIAKGDLIKSWMPSIDFGAQYAVLSKVQQSVRRISRPEALCATTLRSVG